ncbi:MAG: aldehyde ferredoxin oxidoreductase, partial [Candidatus Korarchaeota archaeon]|nr:aldehyde ferredoxin oxidoreductase [Candidatus Korarchaeota archaeon]NIU84050.1 aldehyde ferredoxin oxidoreductase [Candidatus Thorarchaeota archaeon]NIW14193.1 aldehyde ferredoxin oxidoreductase [Candidatus Thorarchaeota archaeon]NIW52299.1 aldehyde ferredoxin oxidoreductase [Candidatus Korarchaeota archaeon]
PRRVNPLSPKNIMVFATGPLTGIRGAPCPGRYAVISKSPKTGAITDSQSGGEWGPYLKFAGFDYIVVRGKSPDPVYLWVHDGEVAIKDADDYWGDDAYGVTDAIKNDTHEEAKILCIGPPGEKESFLSAIMNDKYRAAGRSGLAAVMGSKNLKAIAVHGKRKVPVEDKAGMNKAKKEGIQALQDSDVTKPEGGLNTYGTAVLVNVINENGVFPTRNFQTGVFEDVDNISGETMAGEGPEEFAILEKRTGCWGCQIQCARYTKIKSGPYKGKEGEGPEYETLWSLGADTGVGDLNAVAAANWLCNKYGLDTISTGSTIAFAMEANERGL